MYIDEILNNPPAREKSAEHLEQRLAYNFGSQNIQRLTSFLSSMLEQDNKKRAPTSKLLGHPFLVMETRGELASSVLGEETREPYEHHPPSVRNALLTWWYLVLKHGAEVSKAKHHEI